MGENLVFSYFGAAAQTSLTIPQAQSKSNVHSTGGQARWARRHSLPGPFTGNEADNSRQMRVTASHMRLELSIRGAGVC